MHLRKSMSTVVGAVVLLVSACNSGPRGVYSDNAGAVILELKSGGKANFTFMGDVQDCSYESGGNQLALSCKGEGGKTVFAIHDDGSLAGPPGSFMPPLRKQK
jgi:hypothetical protein